jgi:4-hydroxy-4-methyl-2-oxoglutarate aldolase
MTNHDLMRILKRLGPMPTPFAVYSTAFLGDAMEKLGMQNRILDPGIRPLIPFTRVVGIAVTIKLELATKPVGESATACYGSAFEAGKQVLSPLLVIEAPFTKYGTLGSGAAHVFSNQSGFVGAVVDGVIRDTDELARMNFQVFYRYITPEHVDGIARGVSANETVTVGEVRVSPGDVIVGDNDGVVAIPQADISRVMEVADEIMAIEERILREMDEGKTYQEAGEKYFKDLLRKVER